MGLRDRLFGRASAPDEEPPTKRDDVDREARIAHLEAMLARGSITEREYRQEYRRLAGE